MAKPLRSTEYDLHEHTFDICGYLNLIFHPAELHPVVGKFASVGSLMSTQRNPNSPIGSVHNLLLDGYVPELQLPFSPCIVVAAFPTTVIAGNFDR